MSLGGYNNEDSRTFVNVWHLAKEEDKAQYEDLINDLNVGNTLEATLKNIDHQALADIDNWHKKFEVILYLSKAPLMMKINNFNVFSFDKIMCNT